MNVQTTAGSTAFVAAAAAASGAFAADLPSHAVAPTPALPLLATWQGFYVGGTVGASWLNSSIDDTAAAPIGVGYGIPSGNRSSSSAFGALAGAHIGYNIQQRNLVFGLEGDLSWVGARSSANSVHTTSFTGYYSYAVSGTTRKESRVSALGTLRARFGIDLNGTMPYLTGGVAFGRITDRYTFTDTTGYYGSTTSSKSKWATGLVVGAGIEHQITNNISLRGELLWVGFPDRSHNIPSVSGGDGGIVRSSTTMAIGRVGLSYHF